MRLKRQVERLRRWEAEAQRTVNTDRHYSETVPRWHRIEGDLRALGREIAAALRTGKCGYDFRTARPYYIGHVGGRELIYWPTADGSPNRRLIGGLVDICGEGPLLERLASEIRRQIGGEL